MPPDLPGYYLIARLDGQDVAAIGMPEPISTAAWNTYVAVDDADAAAETVSRAGGRVTSEPQDAGPGGRWAGVLDPTGAPFRLWQARRRLGAQLVNAPGSWNFSDLHTDDPARRQVVLRRRVRLGGRRARLRRRPRRDDVAPARLRRPPGGDGRPGHPRATGRHQCAAGLRRRDRVAGTAASPARHPTGTSRSPSPIGMTASPLPCGSAPRTCQARSTRRGRRSAVVRDPQGAVFTLSQFAPQG